MGISTHVLDTSRGQPAKDIHIVLERLDVLDKGGATATAVSMGTGVTNSDGRCVLLDEKHGNSTYRISFAIGPYLTARNTGNKGSCSSSKYVPFYPEASVVFTTQETQRHYHIPLLLNDFGYTTYRGS